MDGEGRGRTLEGGWPSGSQGGTRWMNWTPSVTPAPLLFITTSGRQRQLLTFSSFLLPPLSHFHHLSRLTLELHRTSSSLLEGVVANMTTRAVIMSVRGEKETPRARSRKSQCPKFILFIFFFFLRMSTIRQYVGPDDANLRVQFFFFFSVYLDNYI